jgi:hypothetical protein
VHVLYECSEGGMVKRSDQPSLPPLLNGSISVASFITRSAGGCLSSHLRSISPSACSPSHDHDQPVVNHRSGENQVRQWMRGGGLTDSAGVCGDCQQSVKEEVGTKRCDGENARETGKMENR